MIRLFPADNRSEFLSNQPQVNVQTAAGNSGAVAAPPRIAQAICKCARGVDGMDKFGGASILDREMNEQRSIYSMRMHIKWHVCVKVQQSIPMATL